MNAPERTSLLVNVARLTWASPNGTAIFTCRDNDESVRVVAKRGVLPFAPSRGESWELIGRYQVHPKYGQQFHAQSGRLATPRGKLIVEYLAHNAAFAGMGETKAAALYEAFGDSLMDVLGRGDAKALETVLSESMTARLIEAWAEKENEAKVISALDKYQFDMRIAKRMLNCWGECAIQMLETNPYHMLAFSSWSVVDKCARKMGVSDDDPRRLIGMVEATLYARLDGGHTLTSCPDILSALGRKGLNAAYGRKAIALALDDLAIVGDERSGYQPLGAAALESGIERRFGQMLASEVPEQGELFAKSALEAVKRVQAVIEKEEATSGFKFNVEQLEAIVGPFKHQLCVITGGAGVGKTTVIKTIITSALSMHKTVFSMALSGRAAMRITESTGYPACTIAKFLTDAKNERITLTSESVVIVDEASMLDLPTLYRILHFMPLGARLVLVGDPAQLPPIGFGLVLHRLVDLSHIPKVSLSMVHRQAESTGIPLIAHQIRRHEAPRLPRYCGKAEGVSFLASPASDVVPQLDRLMNDWAGEDVRIVAALKGGACGIDAINEHFHGKLSNDANYAPGEKVMHTFNDHDLGLMNGSLGTIVSVEEGHYVAEFDGTQHKIPFVEAFERLLLAYAITVHKAQGSQFDRVAVVVTPSRLLEHSLIYTAMTRAVKQVVFVGVEEALVKGIVEPSSAFYRIVGLCR